jgi:hypothetical protein
MADPIDHYRRVWALQNFDDADLGSRFYRDAWSWCTSRTQLYGLPARDIAYCVAAISPMKKWDENLRLTDLMLRHVVLGEAKPPLMSKRYEAAYNALAYRLPPTGPKVSAFARNIAGDLTVVTVDRHMMDMAECKDVAECAMAVARVADSTRDLWPAEVQAILWYTWRRLKGYEAYRFTA